MCPQCLQVMGSWFSILLPLFVEMNAPVSIHFDGDFRGIDTRLQSSESSHVQADGIGDEADYRRPNDEQQENGHPFLSGQCVDAGDEHLHCVNSNPLSANTLHH